MKARKKLDYPVLTDHWLDLAFAIKYIIFFLFGVAGAISSVPAIAEVGGAVYESLWTIGIATVSAAASLLVFANIHTNYLRTQYVKYEWYATILVTSLIASYSGALLVLAAQGYDRRISLSVISVALLVFPIYRIKFLFGKLRGE